MKNDLSNFANNTERTQIDGLRLLRRMGHFDSSRTSSQLIKLPSVMLELGQIWMNLSKPLQQTLFTRLEISI